MFRPRVIPCLLLQGKGLVKTIRFKSPTYIGDPINAVRLFNEMEADELVFLDIQASREGRTIPLELVAQIGDEAYMPFSVGGGISSVEQVRDILQAGAEKVVINSAALRDPRCIEALAGEFGSQSIVVSIDVRKRLFGAYDVFGMGGTKRFAADPVEHAIRVCRHGAGEILLTAIDRDGTMQGYDLELIRQFSAAVSIPVVAAGGAGGLEDCLRAVENGASAVAAGSLFVYYGLRKGVLINYPEKEELRKLFGRAVRHPA